jgi:hypothetical protein
VDLCGAYRFPSQLALNDFVVSLKKIYE